MTNTETGGTAPEAIWATPTRLTYDNPDWSHGEYYNEHGAAGLGVKYIRADIASRPQSPAEWRVSRDELAQLIHDAGAPPAPPCSPIRSLPETHFVRVRAYRQADAVLALRAASIPAPERSKEETVEVKASSLLAIRDALAADNLNEAWHELHTIADPDFCEMKPWRNLEHKAALETPPLHKEGEAVAALRDAIAWIVEAPHDEHCFTNDPNPDACRCVCGKDSILDRLYEAGPPDDRAYEEAPAPVPVTITDEMVERLARHYAENHGVPPDEPLYEGSEQLAWHAWVDDARAALIAALSAKPGDQG